MQEGGKEEKICKLITNVFVGWGEEDVKSEGRDNITSLGHETLGGLEHMPLIISFSISFMSLNRKEASSKSLIQKKNC